MSSLSDEQQSSKVSRGTGNLNLEQTKVPNVYADKTHRMQSCAETPQTLNSDRQGIWQSTRQFDCRLFWRTGVFCICI